MSSKLSKNSLLLLGALLISSCGDSITGPTPLSSLPSSGGEKGGTSTSNMTAPDTPVIKEIIPGNTSIKLIFDRAQNTSSAPLTGYQYTLDNEHWLSPAEWASDYLIIAYLTNGTEYPVRVRAINSIGNSSATESIKATPLSTASAPLNLSVVPGDEQLRVTFGASANNGGSEITQYQYSLNGADWIATPFLTNFSFTVSGLQNGIEYSIRLRALNKMGPGEISATVWATPLIVSPVITTLIRSVAKSGLSYYMPQRLDALGPVFGVEATRALARYKALHGREAVTLFEKVQAAADYVANMAKHPARHIMDTRLGPNPANTSDPRVYEFANYPEKLALLAQENQVWNGTSWDPAPGKTLDDVARVECTFQHFILGGIVNQLGAQWMLLSISSHDAFTYYDQELGKWVYIESSFNEHYRSLGSDPTNYVPLSPMEMRSMSLANDASMIPVLHPYQPQRVEENSTYYVRPYVEMHPYGFSAMVVNMNGLSVGNRNMLASHARAVPGGTTASEFGVHIALGWLWPTPEEDIWAPQSETFLDALVATSNGNIAHLSTNLAVSSPIFERSVNGGAWQTVSSAVSLDGLVGNIRFRARSGSMIAGIASLSQAPKNP